MNISSMLAVNHYFEKWRLITSIISGAGACFGIMISPFIFYLFAKKDKEHSHEEHTHLGIMKECELYLIIASGNWFISFIKYSKTCLSRTCISEKIRYLS